MSAGWDPGTLAPDPEDVVKCVGCGLCLPHCPTFRLTGRETASPRGRIAAMRAVEEGEAQVGPAFTRMMDECLACRACEAACPSGVPYGRMIEAARAQAEPLRPARIRLAKRIGLAAVLPRRRLVMAAMWGVALARAARLDRLLPSPLRSSLPPATLRELARPVPREAGDGATVAMVLTGCVMDGAFRPAQRATMELVGRCGMTARRPAPGGCCGALAMHHGYPEAARRMARARIAEWEDADLVVVNASGCSAHVKAYGELLAEDPAWAGRARRVAARAVDAIELRPPPTAGPAAVGPVAVHDACHHIHAQGIDPRPQLRAAGGRCAEVADGGRCCGAAGLYTVLQPGMSARLRREKALAVDATGAPVVAVANPGCAIQIAAGLREIGSSVRVAHPAELIAPPDPRRTPGRDRATRTSA